MRQIDKDAFALKFKVRVTPGATDLLKAVKGLITNRFFRQLGSVKQWITWRADEKLPITRACGCVGLSRAAYYRKPIDQSVKDAPVVDVLNQIVAKHGRWGFGLCFSWMRNNGYL